MTVEFPETFATATLELRNDHTHICNYWFKNESENYAVMSVDTYGYFSAASEIADHSFYMVTMSIIVGHRECELAHYEAMESEVFGAMHRAVESLKNHFRMSQTCLALLEEKPSPNENPTIWKRLRDHDRTP